MSEIVDRFELTSRKLPSIAAYLVVVEKVMVSRRGSANAAVGESPSLIGSIGSKRRKTPQMFAEVGSGGNQLRVDGITG